MNRRAFVPLVLAALASGTVVGATGPSAAAASCSIEQVTNTSTGGGFANTSPNISRDGSTIVFASATNIGGGNGDLNQEVFHYDRAADDFTQITLTTGGTFANREPAPSADGSVIAFSSDRNIGGHNADLGREIFRWSAGAVVSLTTAVTETAGDESNNSPTINDAGTRIAFGSNADLTGGNSDGNDEIFLFRTNGSATSQVTTTSGGANGEPDLDASGNHLAFSSDRSFGAVNADHNPEVFLRNLVTGATQSLSAAASPVESYSPAVNGTAARVAFNSDGAFAGRNADGSTETFLREPAAGSTTTLTPGPGGTFNPGDPAINTAGTRVAIESQDDLTGDNADGNYEIYLRDFQPTGVRLLQVTHLTTASAGEVDIDGSGRHVVFSSTGNVTGGNADGNREIFLATCSAPPAPALCGPVLVTVNRARNEQPTTANDVIRGTNGADTILGKGGNDRFCGLNGADTFNGGPGNDRAFGQNGDDRLRGDGGNDELDGGANADTLNGGPGTDTCRGGSGTDTGTACERRPAIP
jgi:Tol biopolymer transport system component